MNARRGEMTRNDEYKGLRDKLSEEYEGSLVLVKKLEKEDAEEVEEVKQEWVNWKGS